jgi:hypothetical protein
MRSMKEQSSVVGKQRAKRNSIVRTARGWAKRQAARIKHRRERREQRATDDLYSIVRTARGWVRQASRTNDSRELQEALETILSLVQDHADLVAVHGRCLRTVPTIYWTHADKGHEPLNRCVIRIRIGTSSRNGVLGRRQSS